MQSIINVAVPIYIARLNTLDRELHSDAESLEAELAKEANFALTAGKVLLLSAGVIRQE